jgi:hypothetical protein
LNFDHNSNLSLARFHTIIVCQFYSDSFFFFCNQLQLTKEENQKKNCVIILQILLFDGFGDRVGYYLAAFGKEFEAFEHLKYYSYLDHESRK